LLVRHDLLQPRRPDVERITQVINYDIPSTVERFTSTGSVAPAVLGRQAGDAFLFLTPKGKAFPLPGFGAHGGSDFSTVVSGGAHKCRHQPKPAAEAGCVSSFTALVKTPRSWLEQ